jgi:hypothetical protein
MASRRAIRTGRVCKRLGHTRAYYVQRLPCDRCNAGGQPSDWHLLHPHLSAAEMRFLRASFAAASRTPVRITPLGRVRR